MNFWVLEKLIVLVEVFECECGFLLVDCKLFELFVDWNVEVYEGDIEVSFELLSIVMELM